MSRSVRAAAAAMLVGGVLSGVGCLSADRPGVQDRYYGFADPCWPDRYSYQAREAVLAPLDAQVTNATVLNNTVWNYYFEEGSDKLTLNGRSKLDQIARHRGGHDGNLFLQTARDLPFDQLRPEKLAAARTELDVKRANVILAYMGTQPSKVAYNVTPIDAAEPGIGVQGPSNAMRGFPIGYRSGITGAVGSAQQGAGGNAAAANVGQQPQGQGQPGGGGGQPAR